MENAFIPINQREDWITLCFGLTATIGLLVLIWQLKHKRQSTNSELSNMPILLLVALATMLAVGGFVYGRNTTLLLETIEINTNYIRIPYGTIDLAEIKNVYIYEGNSNGFFNVSLEERAYLIIEEYNSKRHSISSKVYDIDPIHSALEEAIQENISFEIRDPEKKRINILPSSFK